MKRKKSFLENLFASLMRTVLMFVLIFGGFYFVISTDMNISFSISRKSSSDPKKSFFNKAVGFASKGYKTFKTAKSIL